MSFGASTTSTPSPPTWAGRLEEAVDRRFEQMVRVRRHLHAHPEPSGQEVRTTQYLLEQVLSAGLEARAVVPPASGPARGLIVEAPAGAAAPAAPAAPADRLIVLRADIDALRIQDAKTVEYRSQVPGVMHACGHDAHAATVLGAAWALADAARAGALPWPVRWRAIFQPAEETNQGALEMIEAGALRGAGAILSLHADPSRRAGTVGVRPGAFTAACDELYVELSGRGGHAARPHESLDPIAAAAQLVTSVYLFVPRGIDTHDPVVITFGQITGGDNANVIPDKVILRGTVRTLGEAVRRRALEHIRRLARGLAEGSEIGIDVQFRGGPPSVQNDPELTDLVRSVASAVLGPQHVRPIPRPSMGGEDFAHYLAHVPGCMFRLGCATAAEGGGSAAEVPSAPPVTLHSPRFDLDERAMAVGAKVLARSVVRWCELSSPPSRRDSS